MPITDRFGPVAPVPHAENGALRLTHLPARDRINGA